MTATTTTTTTALKRRSREGEAGRESGARGMMRPPAGGGTVAGLLILAVVMVVALGGTYRRQTWPEMLLRSQGGGAASSSSVLLFFSGEENHASPSSVDKLHGGLLSPDFEEASCLSRYQAALYRKPSPYSPSAHLLRRLRDYEALHRKCAPHTDLYNRSAALLRSAAGNASAPAECNYVVWIPHNGIGNRVLTIVSAFFYALLNHKVLLLHSTDDFAGLLCEPFPGTTWTLPADFPLDNLLELDTGAPQSFGNLLKSKDSSIGSRSHVYLHLPWYYREGDKRFFCEDAQRTLRKVPWLLLKSDHYFVPSLFLVPEYAGELRRLFPERSAVFHHLVRYLLHPSNEVWDRVVGYYREYLEGANERVGIQIRVFDNFPVPFDQMLNQVMNCSLGAGVLPAVTGEATSSVDAKVKAVVVTNLRSGYSERIREVYRQRATATGEVVQVFQPSHEEAQATEHRGHNVQALAEIELLSLSDVLVTSAWSTFGYVAQGLGGLKPWVLLRHTQSADACRRASSPEPCFLMPPAPAQCFRDGGGKAILSNVRQCEDEVNGIKLFD
ncbi:putative fucosyltransferase 8 [Curcuma longa]|uniref:putative fucosyltransferase 8 n=1 Tax=Curcuma longa TaxID=136217 RepID=UPI003D9EF282